MTLLDYICTYTCTFCNLFTLLNKQPVEYFFMFYIASYTLKMFLNSQSKNLVLGWNS